MDESSRHLAVTSARFARVREIFESVLDEPRERRRARLEAACAGDLQLLQEVEGLLAADQQPHHFLDRSDDATWENGGLTCAACATGIDASHQFCPRCGVPTSAAPPVQSGRFQTGALFAGRFRIVALQGRGGMGEVYRAQDIELGQPVALKFLTGVRSSQHARARLRAEVRLARQISHPNVCRVYDIGEASGHLYLSMEYIEGEDLAALLKRVGRVMPHKGIEIARKLCAGLAAAHGRGVLHRDLKPGNIMVDSHDEVRIMDFGLAAAVEQELDAADVRSGTPAYMAPEQLGGREATRKSDIYALGLVLYELFTGAPAFAADTAAEFLRQRAARPPIAPSAIVPELPPAVERTILRCLDPDPHQRPATALDVAASLPGGDPLAEVLAAGETPSPELVAAAGPEVVTRPAVAAALLAAIGLGLMGVLMLTQRTQIAAMTPMPHAPEVLASKAHDIVNSLGYGAAAVDSAYGVRDEQGYVPYMTRRISSDRSGIIQWKELLQVRPSPVSFWYSESEGSLVPPVAYTGKAVPADAVPAVHGGVSVDLDLDGRLLRFVASPERTRATAASTAGADWQRLFTAAGLDLSAFRETAPHERTSREKDAAIAWSGRYPGHPDLPVYVEGAARDGAATSFTVRFPWTRRDPMLAGRTHYSSAALLVVIWVAPFFVAAHNWRCRRADVRGALRLGTFVFLTHLGALMLTAHDPVNAFVTRPVLWLALALGAWASIVYIALEPWVRRWWPHAMVGWTRVLAGRWRDPLVARDVLVGLALVIGYRCVYLLAVFVGIHQGASPTGGGSVESTLGEFVLSQLARPQFAAANILNCISVGVSLAAVSFFLLAMFRALLRDPWRGTAAFCVCSFVWSSLQPEFRAEWVTVATYPILLGVWIFGAVRYGLLTVVIGGCAYRILAQSALTADLGAWFAHSSLLAVVSVGGLALWAFRVSVGSSLRVSPS